MTERERLVEDVVKAAGEVVDIWGLPRGHLDPPCVALIESVKSLRAHDAAPKPLKWGCQVVEMPDGKWDVQSADGKCFLGLGFSTWFLYHEDDEFATKGNRESESEALAALDACTTPPPGYAEPTGNIVSPRIDLTPGSNVVEPTDDPQATPAGDTDTLAFRVAELERKVVGLEATLNTTSAEANRAHVRISGAEALLHEARSWLSLCAHRLASDAPKVHEPSRADILAVCAKIDKATSEPPLTVAEVSKANKDVPLDQRVDELDVWASSMTDIVAQLRRDANGLGERVGALIIDVDTIRATAHTASTKSVGSVSMPERTAEDRARVKQMVADELARRKSERDTTPTPSPEPLPFGCVCVQESDNKWIVKNASGTYWWCLYEWAKFNNGGWAPTAAEAIADFHSTNGGKVPPPDHKPASKARYEVVDAGGSQWIVRDKRTGYMYVAHSNGWTNADHYSTFRVADIAEAVRDALEARNA